MAADEPLEIQIVYGTPAGQHRLALTVPRGTTIRAAIDRSRLGEHCPELDLAVNRVGIYGILCDLDTLLEDGDRLEIYRPLAADPKEIRRRRARR